MTRNSEQLPCVSQKRSTGKTRHIQGSVAHHTDPKRIDQLGNSTNGPCVQGRLGVLTVFHETDGSSTIVHPCPKTELISQRNLRGTGV